MTQRTAPKSWIPKASHWLYTMAPPSYLTNLMQRKAIMSRQYGIPTRQSLHPIGAVRAQYTEEKLYSTSSEP